MQKNFDLISTTREAAGPNVDLMAEVYTGWNMEYARRMLFWIKESVITDNLEESRHITPVGPYVNCGRWHEYILQDFHPDIDTVFYDTAQFNVNHVTSITAA